MPYELTDRERRAADLAVQAGKSTVITVWEEIASDLAITPQAAKELLEDLIARGVLYQAGAGARNVSEDPHGASRPIAWYAYWETS